MKAYIILESEGSQYWLGIICESDLDIHTVLREHYATRAAVISLIQGGDILRLSPVPAQIRRNDLEDAEVTRPRISSTMFDLVVQAELENAEVVFTYRLDGNWYATALRLRRALTC